MPRGGARAGAGRKPTRKKRAVVLGLDGSRLPDGAIPPQLPPSPSAEAAVEIESLAIAPKKLPKDQAGFWNTYAPSAIEQGTLTPATVAGFRELCEQWAFKEKLAAAIRRKGAATLDAQSDLRAYVRLAQRVDSSLARFKLTSFGKAVETIPIPKQKPANPWAQVAK